MHGMGNLIMMLLLRLGQRRHIFYNVTREPTFGRLYVNDALVTQFGQSNIDREELLYVQFNMSASHDSFAATVWNAQIVLTEQVFNISVTPLVTQQRIRAAAGEKTAITLEQLDAGRLAALTNSNPVFRVVRKPRLGRIRRIVPTSGGGGGGGGTAAAAQRLRRGRRQTAKEKDTLVFTQEDVQSEFMFYVARKTELNESVVDSCEYVLTAPNVQPAYGVLEFLVAPASVAPVLAAAGKNTSSASNNNNNSGGGGGGAKNPGQTTLPDIVTENTLSTMGISQDIVLIVGIVCGVLVLGLVILIAVRSVVQAGHGGKIWKRNHFKAFTGCFYTMTSFTANRPLDNPFPKPCFPPSQLDLNLVALSTLTHSMSYCTQILKRNKCVDLSDVVQVSRQAQDAPETKARGGRRPRWPRRRAALPPLRHHQGDF